MCFGRVTCSILGISNSQKRRKGLRRDDDTFRELARFGAEFTVDCMGKGKQAHGQNYGTVDDAYIHQHGRNSTGVDSLRLPTNQERSALN